jgi:hypothetical protein
MKCSISPFTWPPLPPLLFLLIHGHKTRGKGKVGLVYHHVLLKTSLESLWSYSRMTSGRNPESQTKGVYILFVWNSKGYILPPYKTGEIFQIACKWHTNYKHSKWTLLAFIRTIFRAVTEYVVRKTVLPGKGIRPYLYFKLGLYWNLTTLPLMRSEFLCKNTPLETKFHRNPLGHFKWIAIIEIKSCPITRREGMWLILNFSFR